VPFPVGSPPWITNPGMMRWKYVSSKYFERASETNDEVVCGETLTLSLIVNEPQVVWKVAVHVFFGSSGVFGGLLSRLCDSGFGTFGQPLAAVAPGSDPTARPVSTTASATKMTAARLTVQCTARIGA